MKINSLKNYVTKNGGEITKCTETSLEGKIKGYDVEMCCESFFTIRKSEKAGHWDIGSDYNPGGYIFLNKIKHIETFTG